MDQISGIHAGTVICQNHDCRIAIDILGPERILFGSDYPLLRPTRYLREMDKIGLTAENKAAILGGNGLKLFSEE